VENSIVFNGIPPTYQQEEMVRVASMTMATGLINLPLSFYYYYYYYYCCYCCCCCCFFFFSPLQIEYSAFHAAIADKLVDWAGYRERVTILIGSSTHTIPTLKG